MERSSDYPPTPLDTVLTFIYKNLKKVQTTTGISDVTLREEANAMIAYSVRNGFIEDVHASLPGISDAEMKKLMIEATARLAGLLHLRADSPAKFRLFVHEYGASYCKAWEKTALEYTIPDSRRLSCEGCNEVIRSCWRWCPKCGVEQNSA